MNQSIQGLRMHLFSFIGHKKIDIRLQLKKYTVPEFSLVELRQMVNIILL